MGRDSAVVVATRYGLGRSGDRILVGANFSALVQSGSGAHLASHTMGCLPGVKRPGCGIKQ